jgi:hypothetical protein
MELAREYARAGWLAQGTIATPILLNANALLRHAVLATGRTACASAWKSDKSL